MSDTSIKSFRVIARVRPEWSQGVFTSQTFNIAALCLPAAAAVIAALRERKLETEAVTYIRVV